jgi:hypothetical protein
MRVSRPYQAIRFDFWLICLGFLSCLENLVAFCHVLDSLTLWEKSLHTHTHCLS